MPITTFQLTGETISHALIKYRPDMGHYFKNLTIQMTMHYEIENISHIKIISISISEDKKNNNKNESCLLNYCAKFLLQMTLIKIYGMTFYSETELDTTFTFSNLGFLPMIPHNNLNLFETQFKFLKCLQYEGFFNLSPSEKNTENEALLHFLNEREFVKKEIFLLRSIYRLALKLHYHKTPIKGSAETISQLGEIIQHHIIANYPEKDIQTLLILYIKHLKNAIKQEKEVYRQTSSLRFFSKFFNTHLGKHYEEALAYLANIYPKTNFNDLGSLNPSDNLKDPWVGHTIMYRPR